MYISYLYTYYTCICHMYFQMVCQKLCQNSVSGRGPLEKRRCFLMICPVAWIRWSSVMARRSPRSTAPCRRRRVKDAWVSRGRRRFSWKIGGMMIVNGLCLVDDDLGQVGNIFGEKSFRIHNHQYGKYLRDDWIYVPQFGIAWFIIQLGWLGLMVIITIYLMGNTPAFN